MRDDSTRSALWLDVEIPRFAPLSADIEVDVAVIGGGIAGITTAWLLAREGRRVMLLEAERLGGTDRVHSAAHLTCITDLPLHETATRFGESAARTFWDAGRAGIELVAQTVSGLAVDCDFRWTPGYLHVAPGRASDVSGLRREADLAARFGIDALFLVSVPGVGQPGVRFGRQAIFHPLCYAAALVRDLMAMGAAIHEESTLEALAGSPPRLTVNSRTVRCRQVVLASDSLLFDRRLAIPNVAAVRDRLIPCRSFFAAAALPAGTHPAALYRDAAMPPEHLRVENTIGGQVAVLGGLDARADEPVDDERKFDALERRFEARLSGVRPTHRWSGPTIRTEDGLPLIGMLGAGVFVIAGLQGNTVSLGSIGATMAHDACLGRVNAYSDLFDPLRPRWSGSLWRSLSRRFGRWGGTAAGGPAPDSGDRPAPL